MPNDQPIHSTSWAKTIFVMLLAMLLGVILLLNMRGVIEPSLDLVFFRYVRAGLPMVLLITATLGFVVGLCFTSVAATLREFRATRRRVDAASLVREVAALQAGSASASAAE
jgi:hypothetical protein